MADSYDHKLRFYHCVAHNSRFANTLSVKIEVAYQFIAQNSVLAYLHNRNRLLLDSDVGKKLSVTEFQTGPDVYYILCWTQPPKT